MNDGERVGKHRQQLHAVVPASAGQAVLVQRRGVHEREVDLPSRRQSRSEGCDSRTANQQRNSESYLAERELLDESVPRIDVQLHVGVVLEVPDVLVRRDDTLGNSVHTNKPPALSSN